MTPAQSTDADIAFMRLALVQARDAQGAGEVPVGAVVVKNGQVVGVGHNVCIARSDPSGHAEIVALRSAAAAIGNYRLDGCTLYVTLEPCSMCAGAILNARLDRLVFGAADPKAGACGSVIDVLGNAAHNHDTEVNGGILAQECSQQLAGFFAAIRARKRAQAWPLREDALRTLDQRFEGLPDYPWEPHYINDLVGLQGLRLHYLDVGPKDAPATFLCLHGNPSWSYFYRQMIPVWTGAGCRVLAPDLIGFGKSDKPKRTAQHSFEFHRNYLLDFVERLDLNQVILVVQDGGGILGLTLPMEAPQRYQGLLVMSETSGRLRRFDIGELFSHSNSDMTAPECAAYNAPFPDGGHRAATRAFAKMLAQAPEHPQSLISSAARDFWSNRWVGKAMMAVGAADAGLGSEVMRQLHPQIKDCLAPMLLEGVGHFVPERGTALAQAVLLFLCNT